MPVRPRIVHALPIAVVLALALVGVGVNGKREWQRAFAISQSELTWMASATLLEHHRLQESLRRYGAGHDDVSGEALLERFEIYLSRFEIISDYFERHVGTIRPLDDARLPPDDHTATLLASVKRLRAEGEPLLIALEPRLLALEAGDVDAAGTVQTRLGTLSSSLTELVLAAFERSRHLAAAQTRTAERLDRYLLLSNLAVLLGVLLAGAVLCLHLDRKHRHARQLARANRSLVLKVAESERLRGELEHQVTHDQLSGLLNRHGFERRLESLLDEAGTEHGLCFVDLDMFKIVNDTCGHAAGDALIGEIAALLVAETGPEARVARFGGDEFLVLMPEYERERFERDVRRLCEALRRFRFRSDGRSFDVSGSIGAVHFTPGEHDLQTLLAKADAACYEAKRAGGARAIFHRDDALVETRRSDAARIVDIQRALDEDRFHLLRQPIRPLGDDDGSALHGWEVLVRMIGRDGRTIAPGEFLGFAERSALAPRIDRWVVDHTFAWIDDNVARIARAECLNINLSGRSIGDRDFLAFLERRTATLGVATDKVCFEITETAVAGPEAGAFLARLKALGYRLALDDFGSGFSSFGYLESLPVDTIKIDGLFVRDIDTNATHREFVRAISAVGRAMGKTVVAEFVSNRRSIEILRELGVDRAQGFFVGRPIPLSEEEGDDAVASPRIPSAA